MAKVSYVIRGGAKIQMPQVSEARESICLTLPYRAFLRVTCPSSSTVQAVNILTCIHGMEHDAAMKKSKFPVISTTWVNLTIIPKGARYKRLLE